MAGAVESIIEGSFVLPTLKDLEFDPDFQTTQALIDRIAALESWREDQAEVVGGLTRAIKKQPKTSKDYIGKLHDLCLKEKSHWFSLAEIAFSLEISKETVRKLKDSILEDGRFEMGWAESPGMRGKKGIVFRVIPIIK